MYSGYAAQEAVVFLSFVFYFFICAKPWRLSRRGFKD